jgi:hypothetical protein
LAVAAFFSKPLRVIAFLRFIGLMNSAVWFGAVVVFAALISPALASPEITNLFGGAGNPMSTAYAVVAGEVIITKFVWIHFICGGIAAVHLLVEWLYTGKAIRSLILYLAMLLITLGLLNGLILYPKMKDLHRTRYNRTVAPATQQKAATMFLSLQQATEIIHWIMVGGLLIYTWKVATPGEQPRFNSTRKFKS